MFDEFQTLKTLVGKISPESVPVGWEKNNSLFKRSGEKLCHFLFPLSTFPSDVYIGKGSTAMNLGAYAPSDLGICVLSAQNIEEKRIPPLEYKDKGIYG